jgi:ABC-type cobalamin/Fe3+-siderophores transport system ATPase subunit
MRENIAVWKHRALDDNRDFTVRLSAAWPIPSAGDSPAATTRCWAVDSMAGVELSGGEVAERWRWPARTCETPNSSSSTNPPHALDARAEYQVFLRFSELTAGKMAVLISHRFSTVRMADRILVLRAGELAEQGTHEELVARGGLYAELFQLQAAGYR